MKNKRLDYYYKSLNMPVDENCFLFESYHAENTTGNPYALFNYLKNTDYKKVWVIKEGAKEIPELLNNPNVSLVNYDSEEYYKYLATSKYLINDTSFLSYFVKRDEQIYVNTWHGTPYKTLGSDVNNMNLFDIRNIKRNFLIADYLMMPNQYTADIIENAFQIKSLRNNQLIISGNPRVDLNYSDLDKIKKKYQIKTTKKIVLYAPTWDENGKSSEAIVSELLKKVNYIQNCLGEDYIVKLKVHYFVHEKLKEHNNDEILVPNYFDTNEYMAIVDRVITDYSSIMFDFLPSMKPVYLLMDNYDFYKSERGLYLEVNELPVRPSFNLQELGEDLKLPVTQYMDNNRSLINKALERFCPFDNGSASKRIVEEITDLNNKIRQNNNNNNNMLVMIHNLLDGFILDSAVNFINQQSTNINLTIFTTFTNKDILASFQKRINRPIDFIFKFGYNPIDEETQEKLAILLESNYAQKYDTDTLNYWTFMKSRLFGNTHFSEIINFNHDNIDNHYLIELFNGSKKTLWINADLNSYYQNYGEVKKTNLNTLIKTIDKYDIILYQNDSLYTDNKKFLNSNNRPY